MVMKLKRIFPLLFIISCTIIIFFPVFQGDYLIGWDDDQQIINNPDVLHLSWESFRNYFSTFYVNSYQPLSLLSFGVEYYIFGKNPLVPHITNFLLHIANIVLVYLFLGKILSVKKYLLIFIVAVFAFHPLQTELLGWISTRSTLLSYFFPCFLVFAI